MVQIAESTSHPVTLPAPPSRRHGRLVQWLAAIRTPMGVVAAALLAVVLGLAIVAPILWSDQASAIDTDALSQGASSEHWVGTDTLGRDLFFRVLVATRLSVALALLGTGIGVTVGLLLGSAPWLLGRRLGRLATAVVNIAVAFPALLLALFFAVLFGVGVKGSVLAVGFAMAPWFARMTQTLVAAVQDREFVAAAQIAGAGRLKILLRHILPNVGEPLVVNATLGAGGALLAFAGLSFLGLGVQAPSYDWGLLLKDGLNGIYVHPAGALAPGIAIVIAGLGFNLFGEVVAKKIGLRTANVSAGGAYEADSTGGARVTAPSDATSAGRADTDVGSRPVLVVEGLQVTVSSPLGEFTPVRDVSFSVHRGEAVGVVGESGSGKSLTALAVAQLIERPMRVRADRLEFLGTDLTTSSEREVTRHLLGNAFGLVFQDPTTSFNPTIRIGPQLAEVAQQHQGMSRRQARSRAVERLRDVRVPAAKRRAGQYPHEFSGGMRQRAMIAMAMMGQPALIVGDEPTTALDVTIQRQVLALLQQIREENEVAILLISHDITVVGQFCDRVLVMYAGRIVEDLPADQLRTGARHPYTRALLAAVPDLSADRDEPLPIIPGRPVDPAHLPTGCAFAPRCPAATDKCQTEDPPLVSDPNGRRVACWHPQGRIGEQGDAGAHNEARVREMS